MKNFLKNINEISEKIYDQLGGTEEKYIQSAISIELDKRNIPHLREPSIQIYYDKHPLGFLELDFIISSALARANTNFICFSITCKKRNMQKSFFFLDFINHILFNAA